MAGRSLSAVKYLSIPLLIALPLSASIVQVPFSSQDASSFFSAPTSESDGYWEIPLQPWEGPNDVLAISVTYLGFTGETGITWPPYCQDVDPPMGYGGGLVPMLIGACTGSGSNGQQWTVDFTGQDMITLIPPQPLYEGDMMDAYLGLGINTGSAVSYSVLLLVDPPVDTPEPGTWLAGIGIIIIGIRLFF